MEEYIKKSEAQEAVRNIIASYIPTLRKFQEAIPLELAAAIQNVPKTDVAAVVHAKWIAPDEGYDPKRWVKCSDCGTHFELHHPYVDFTGQEHYFSEIANYCKVCGARMDGE